MTDSLTFDRVGKRFDDTVVLSDVSFTTNPGEFVVLVGPSGCGKSTLLRLVAGLETITDGEIRFGSRCLNDLPPQDRGVGMVFQSYALYPHMTVRENLAFPLYVKSAPARDQQAAVQDVAKILGLGPLLDRYPRQLSGGQRQRVAIGRCLVRKPEIYCFDEPLSNLDAALRAQIRVDIKTLQRKLSKTTLYVTHDQVEAMTLADRIVVLNRGIVQQVGSPRELYASPANRFVARFIGTPSMSVMAGKVSRGSFESGDLHTALPLPDGEVLLGVRVEDVDVLSKPGDTARPDDPLAFEGSIRAIEPVGESGYLHIEVPGLRLDADDPGSGQPQGGSESAATSLLLASVPGRDAFLYELGGHVWARVRPGRSHAFHATNGNAIAVPWETAP